MKPKIKKLITMYTSAFVFSILVVMLLGAISAVAQSAGEG